MTEIIARPHGAVARPLADLVPIIQKQLRLAHNAAEQAAKPYWFEIGKLLIEAKSQLKHGEFDSWCRLHFKFKATQRARYMRAAESADQNFRSPENLSLEDHLKGTSYATGTKPRISVNLGAIRQDELKRSEERERGFKLAVELIDRGYKALTAELHPDKGGSPEAMVRLNEVREIIKRFTKAPNGPVVAMLDAAQRSAAKPRKRDLDAHVAYLRSEAFYALHDIPTDQLSHFFSEIRAEMDDLEKKTRAKREDAA
jgi:hypothetical protein